MRKIQSGLGRFRVLAALVFCCWGGMGGMAQAARFGEIEVTVEPSPAIEGSTARLRRHGDVEHRIRVRNDSRKREYRVRLTGPHDTSSGRYLSLRNNSRTIIAAPGTTQIVSLFQPPIPVFDQSLQVEIDGRKQEEQLTLESPLRTGYGTHSGTSPGIAVLTSRGIPQDYKDLVRSARPDEVVFCRSELPVSGWSPNWLGYTAYDAVLLTTEEVESLPQEVLLAIRRYAEAGGIVLVWSPDADSKRVPERLRGSNTQTLGERGYPLGFGLVQTCPAPDAWPAALWSDRNKSIVPPSQLEVRLPRQTKVPVRGIMTLVILFALGIGPLNVWLLSRRQKRMWLWWNVPLISLATCSLIFLYSLLAEGIRGEGRTALLTLLDEDGHQATSIGYVSYYCPLTPGDGLHFSYDTCVTPLEGDLYSGSSLAEGAAKSIDWTEDQHLASGWVIPRVPTNLGVTKSETRRERLTIRDAGDGVVAVVNGLGVDLKSLDYADRSGKIYHGEEIPAGAERTLAPVTGDRSQAIGDIGSPRQLYEAAWDQSLVELKNSPEKYLRPGCYIAVVAQTPFLEKSLSYVQKTGDFGIVYGIAGAASDGH